VTTGFLWLGEGEGGGRQVLHSPGLGLDGPGKLL
jgi:hypothetical protein